MFAKYYNGDDFNMKKEVWKDVKGYEGLYQVSNKGNVKSLDRLIVYKDGRKRKFKGVKLTSNTGKHGYPYVILSKNEHNKTFKVHRLVARAFIPNPDNLPQVNHKDENRANNNVENLEWCTTKYNINYGHCLENGVKHRDYKKSRAKIDWVSAQRKRVQKLYKPVIQCTLDGKEIKRFRSAKDVHDEVGFDASTIAKCCKGKQKTSHGYKWKYANN